MRETEQAILECLERLKSEAYVQQAIAIDKLVAIGEPARPFLEEAANSEIAHEAASAAEALGRLDLPQVNGPSKEIASGQRDDRNQTSGVTCLLCKSSIPKGEGYLFLQSDGLALRIDGVAIMAGMFLPNEISSATLHRRLRPGSGVPKMDGWLCDQCIKMLEEWSPGYVGYDSDKQKAKANAALKWSQK